MHQFKQVLHLISLFLEFLPHSVTANRKPGKRKWVGFKMQQWCWNWTGETKTTELYHFVLFLRGCDAATVVYSVYSVLPLRWSEEIEKKAPEIWKSERTSGGIREGEEALAGWGREGGRGSSFRLPASVPQASWNADGLDRLAGAPGGLGWAEHWLSASAGRKNKSRWHQLSKNRSTHEASDAIEE